MEFEKGCCKLIPAKSREHDGMHVHSTTENLMHYCDVKCPTCGYYCTLPFEHSDEHDTRHGNMRKTYFVSDQGVFTLGSRKYAPSESGVAEMCNMYCHRAGRPSLRQNLCRSLPCLANVVFCRRSSPNGTIAAGLAGSLILFRMSGSKLGST